MTPDRAAVRRMQAVATGLLLLAAVVFLLTPDDGAWGYVHAAAEASMVGAVADWFAVTALFRHPLGVPVPHTAIIPRRKDDIGRALEDFVATNFLTGPTARDRWVRAGVSARAARWVGREENARSVVTELLPAARRALDLDRVEIVLRLLQLALHVLRHGEDVVQILHVKLRVAFFGSMRSALGKAAKAAATIGSARAASCAACT